MKLIIDITDEQVCRDIVNGDLEPQTETDKVIVDALYRGMPYEERPQGEWITVHYAREELNCPEKSMLDFVKCPFCETIHQGRHNFCSRCGAIMQGGAE